MKGSFSIKLSDKPEWLIHSSTFTQFPIWTNNYNSEVLHNIAGQFTNDIGLAKTLATRVENEDIKQYDDKTWTFLHFMRYFILREHTQLYRNLNSRALEFYKFRNYKNYNVVNKYTFQFENIYSLLEGDTQLVAYNETLKKCVQIIKILSSLKSTTPTIKKEEEEEKLTKFQTDDLFGDSLIIESLNFMHYEIQTLNEIMYFPLKAEGIVKNRNATQIEETNFSVLCRYGYTKIFPKLGQQRKFQPFDNKQFWNYEKSSIKYIFITAQTETPIYTVGRTANENISHWVLLVYFINEKDLIYYDSTYYRYNDNFTNVKNLLKDSGIFSSKFLNQKMKPQSDYISKRVFAQNKSWECGWFCVYLIKLYLMWFYFGNHGKITDDWMNFYLTKKKTNFNEYVRDKAPYKYLERGRKLAEMGVVNPRAIGNPILNYLIQLKKKKPYHEYRRYVRQWDFQSDGSPPMWAT